MKQTCIKISNTNIQTFSIDKHGEIYEKSYVSLSYLQETAEKSIWQSATLADVFVQHLPQIAKNRRKITFILDTSQTLVRITAEPPNSPQNAFPLDNEQENYLFSQAEIGGKTWITAILANVSENIVAACQAVGISHNRIKSINTLEYAATSYFLTLNKPILLILPQPPGIRIVKIAEKSPISCYFFSNDVHFRHWELTRIIANESTKTAILLLPAEENPMQAENPPNEYSWLAETLSKQAIQLTIEQNIENAIKYICKLEKVKK